MTDPITLFDHSFCAALLNPPLLIVEIARSYHNDWTYKNPMELPIIESPCPVL